MARGASASVIVLSSLGLCACASKQATIFWCEGNDIGSKTNDRAAD